MNDEEVAGEVEFLDDSEFPFDSFGHVGSGVRVQPRDGRPDEFPQSSHDGLTLGQVEFRKVGCCSFELECTFARDADALGNGSWVSTEHAVHVGGGAQSIRGTGRQVPVVIVERPATAECGECGEQFVFGRHCVVHVPRRNDGQFAFAREFGENIVVDVVEGDSAFPQFDDDGIPSEPFDQFVEGNPGTANIGSGRQ